MDHYKTLGVAKNATPDDIKKAYRRLAAIHHPDKGGDTAEFQKVQLAYETLSDPQKKQQYDNPNPYGQGMPGAGFPGGFSFHMNGVNINDIFGTMFGDGFARGGAFKPQPPSYRTAVNLTLEQVYNGGEQVLQFNDHTGSKVIKIEIPKGVENGQTMRYDNLIKDSILLVEFRVQPHQNFERQGPHLYSIHEINVLDLIVGSSFTFKTISGKTVDVTVPPKSQPGSKLRLIKSGLPINNDFGDQYILLKPFIPDIIDERILDAISNHK
jgi:DnaJ-class molecular chaperone